MARIDAAYTYFLTTYGQNLGSKYESHKKSELRETYNNIIKANKEAPLYKITQKANVAELAIDIKEKANDIYNAINNMTAGGDDISAILDKRTAISSDPDSLAVEYIGDTDSDIEGFSIEIDSLAKPQLNVGKFLDPSMKSFEAGQYSFDLDTRSGGYEFNYNVYPADTNLDVQGKIVRLINTAGVGLSAELISNDNGETAVSITSKGTGFSEDDPYMFSISSSTSWRELNTLGIDNVTEFASNAHFKLNGNEHTAMSNTFTVNKSFEVTLRYPSNAPISISMVADTEALEKGTNTLLDSFNGFRGIANNTINRETGGILNRYISDLSDIGISVDEAGMLQLNAERFEEKVNSPDRQQVFDTLNKFKDTLKNYADKASINPINYVDKIVVEYKNPKNTYAYPYAASQYSGMLVDYGL